MKTVPTMAATMTVKPADQSEEHQRLRSLRAEQLGQPFAEISQPLRSDEVKGGLDSTGLTLGVELHDGAHFDPAPPGLGDLLGPLQGLVQVGDVQQVEAPEHLFGLGERTVGEHRLPALPAWDMDGGRGIGVV
jgi:hypothetical protein